MQKPVGDHPDRAKHGYHFKEWQVMSGGVTIKDDKFTMPSANVEVKAIFEEETCLHPPSSSSPLTATAVRPLSAA